MLVKETVSRPQNQRSGSGRFVTLPKGVYYDHGSFLSEMIMVTFRPGVHDEGYATGHGCSSAPTPVAGVRVRIFPPFGGNAFVH